MTRKSTHLVRAALCACAVPATAQAIPPSPRPHDNGRHLVHPSPAPRVIITPRTTSTPWTSFTNQAPFNAGAMVQLTDGTLLVQDQGPSNSGSGNWYRLTPDINGSYTTGSWTQVASLPTGYEPLYFAVATLPSGRVIIEGGEYNKGVEAWTNQGAIYDPVANTWTAVKHPVGSQWVRIGDGPASVLSNGIFMLGASGYSGTTAEALLNAATLKWKITGTGKADGNGEEGWSLLPNGDLLTVDTNNGTNTELYTPKTGAWTSAGNTPASLIAGGEVGPQILLPNGIVFATGATGANALYNTKTKTWSAGPSFPIIASLQYDIADGAAAVLPDGKVLTGASPGIYQIPTHFWLFDGTNLTQQPDPVNADGLSSDDFFMIVLPTGQIMVNDRVGNLSVFTDGGTPLAAAAPIITTVPTTLATGTAYTVTGKQLNGLTQGAAYGDDYQSATNFPLVRVTNTATGHVFYGRTTGMTYMGVEPGTKSSASFTLPAATEAGASTLVVVANGIASAPVSVSVTN